MIYGYVFFTIFRFWEKVPSKWWSEWKTIFTLCILEFYVSATMLNFIVYWLNIHILSNMTVLILILITIYLGNYFRFGYKQKWKNDVLKFSDINSVLDRIGVTMVVLFVVTIVVSSCHLGYVCRL